MIIEITNSVKIILTEIANEINDIVVNKGIYIINKESSSSNYEQFRMSYTKPGQKIEEEEKEEAYVDDKLVKQLNAIEQAYDHGNLIDMNESELDAVLEYLPDDVI